MCWRQTAQESNWCTPRRALMASIASSPPEESTLSMMASSRGRTCTQAVVTQHQYGCVDQVATSMHQQRMQPQDAWGLPCSAACSHKDVHVDQDRLPCPTCLQANVHASAAPFICASSFLPPPSCASCTHPRPHRCSHRPRQAPRPFAPASASGVPSGMPPAALPVVLPSAVPPAP